MTDAGLVVDMLRVEYGSRRSPVRAVDGVGFTIDEGKSVGLVGESGCGKSTTARAAIRLLPQLARITGGTVRWNGHDLTNLSEQELRHFRWREIAFVPQASMNALNPVLKVGGQIFETLQVRGRMTPRASHQRTEELCSIVGIDPGRLGSYPHQLSGGMRQRMVIALALALQPRLLVADEATTGLDVIVQDRILSKLIELQRAQRFSMLYVSHDLGLIMAACQTILVMYAGRIVESGNAHDVYAQPAHPYTIGLKNTIPTLRVNKSLTSIAGHPPNLREDMTGCRFSARCPFATAKCEQEDPTLQEVSSGRLVACHYADKAAEFRNATATADVWKR